MQSLNIFIRDTLEVNLDDYEDLNKHESISRKRHERSSVSINGESC